MSIKILFEDKNLLVIDKPAGVMVHSDGKVKTKTVSDWILLNYPTLKNVGEPFLIEREGGKKEKILRPGIVHRLDKETSGVLIIAKNQKTFLFLKEQFQSHKIKKIYRAFVYGFVSDPKASLATGKRGVINVAIGRSQKDIRAFTAGRGAREPLRDAVTEYIILNKFTDTKNTEEKKNVEHQFSYVEAYPKTGRTHQIRVHMRYINHPVVSDPIYRGAKDLSLGMKRLALHAHSVTFHLPSGELKTIESPLPADFKKVIKTYIDNK
ncbi:MAG: RluA family pseudouridine synthase [Candidatus Nomurabacteria bacterium]|nr:RluA family pseudouridine synthase [Candidatus Nomurabacteria bacterium]